MDETVREAAADHGIPPDDIVPVTGLNSRINELFEASPEIASVYVLGEITNLSTSADGHRFFALADADAKISCVMFDDHAEPLDYDLADGDRVLVEATAEYYERDGRASLKVYEAIPVGEGAYLATIRQRKKQLAEEGLFDDAHTTAVPRLPEQVGMVTSRHGAAVQDMIDAIHARHDGIDILVKHAAVQGDDAVDDIIAGLAYLDSAEAVDVILVGRGGGPVEDLDAFNQEAVVRAVFDCDTPVVSGVGHRTDETLVGLVADHGAITPTAAGEHVAPRKEAVEQDLAALEERLDAAYHRYTEQTRQEERLAAAVSRERLYQGLIVLLVCVVVVLLGVVLL